jgi:hypothetical protein
MAIRIHRRLIGIARQRYELSRQLQDLHVDVTLFSETILKTHNRNFISNYHFSRTDRNPGKKAEQPLQLEKKFLKPCSPTTPCFRRSDRGLHTTW